MYICKKSGHLARQCETYKNVKKAFGFSDMMNARYTARGKEGQTMSSKGKGEADSGPSFIVGPDGTTEVPRDVSSDHSKDVDETRVGQEAEKPTLEVGVADGGTAPPVVDTEQGKMGKEEDGMDIGVTADQSVVELENPEDGVIPGPLACPLSGLSSEAEEDEEDGVDEEDEEEELEDESGSLVCGQGVVRSSAEDKKLSSKRFRVGEENVSSPLPTARGVGACS